MDQLLLPGDKLFVIADETKPKSKIQNKQKLKYQTTNGVDFKVSFKVLIKLWLT